MSVFNIKIESIHHLNLAFRYAIQFTRPTIWVVCGLPAGGKSTIAREVAKILGMQILQMDANIIFIECAASYEMLKKRLADREKTVCISDARLRHLKQLNAHFEPLDELQK